jgi:enamine deaminase RidA (YjgF/YER057c/UK114 family)
MNTNNVVTRTSTGTGAEQRLKDLHITLPAPPTPFGSYAEAVQTGNLLFLSGMLPTDGRAPAFVGRLGAELDVETAARAARLAALNALAVAREHLGSLDKVTRVVRLSVDVGRCPRSAESRGRRLEAAARRVRRSEEPLPPRIRRREPSPRRPGGVGSDLRGGVVMLALRNWNS